MNTPPKYCRTSHWPESETVHEDDFLSDYANEFVDKEIVITEKLDGGCTTLFNGEVYARSTGMPSHDGWMAMVRKHHSWKTHQFPNIAFYGEDLFGVHSISYNALLEDETYYLFAVREGDTFVSWNDVVMYANMLHVKTVPVIFRGIMENTIELTKFMQAQRKTPSALGPEKEGFIIRHPEKFNAADFEKHVVKYVRKNHVQTKDKHWRKNWQSCQLKK